MEASSSTKRPRPGATATTAATATAAVPLSSVVGNAVILLRDWGRFGLEERSLYHFDLTDALVSPETDAAADEPRQEPLADSPSADDDVEPGPDGLNRRSCGFRALLECVPRDVRLRSEQKRKLRIDVRALNNLIRQNDDKTAGCRQPMRLPLKINTNSTIFFAYETTRMAFVLDASPALTSTFGGGHSGSQAAICPLDRLGGMSRTFFSSLVQPVRASMPHKQSNAWTPKLTVSVLAVYPRRPGEEQCRTSLLVRDFRLGNQAAAAELADKIKNWTYTTVETAIAQNVRQQQPFQGALSPDFDGGSPKSLVPTCLRDILDVANISLSTLSSSAKPVTVLATCARGLVCDTTLDILSDSNRADNPLVVLDLSDSKSHASPASSQLQASLHVNMDLLNHDPDDAWFPLQLSDDAEALYGICKATGGCYFDKNLLQEAANALAGEIQSGSTLFADHLFSHKRHAFHPNAVQWYTLFSLSPLVPTTGSHLGRLPCPAFLRQKTPRSDESAKIKSEQPSTSLIAAPTVPSWLKSVVERRSKMATMRSIFTTYFVNPVRPTSLLLMRIREGYKVKQYGLSTIDPDKVSIQFMLPVDLGVSIHYEMSYRAMAGHGNMVGFAHIKIELSGESSLIRRIKKDFLNQTDRIVAPGLVAQVSQFLCRRIHFIRKEDMVMTYLLPVKWSEALLERNSIFLKRLASMSSAQKEKYFRMDSFDVIVAENDAIFSTSHSKDDIKGEFHSTLSAWATQMIVPGRCFLKRIESSKVLDLPFYCLIELEEKWNRLFSFSIWTPTGTITSVRLGLVASIKRLVASQERMQVLSNPIANFLVGRYSDSDHRWRIQNTKASWNLVNDPQLMPLLIKRRIGIGSFHLLEFKDDYCLLAKLVPMEARGDEEFDEPGDLIQYELHGRAQEMTATLYMESEGGTFWKNSLSGLENTANRSFAKFEKLVNTLKKRDQECSRALQCRTFLLKCLEGSQSADVSTCIRRLLGYSSHSVACLRCFHPDQCMQGNVILQKLTASTLLNNDIGVRTAVLTHDKDLNNALADHNRHASMAWFILEHSSEILSIVCQPSDVKTNNGESFLEIHYFSVEIGDLYSKRDDESDDKAVDDVISTPECVNSFSNFMLQSHKLNYCTAAYLAMLKDPNSRFSSVEWQYVFEPLKFIEVCSVITAGGPRLTDILTSKLVHVLKDVFYYKWDIGDKPMMESVLDDHSHAYSFREGNRISDYDETGSSGDEGMAFGDDLYSDYEGMSLDQHLPAKRKEKPDTVEGSKKCLLQAPIFAKVTGLDEEGSISKKISISISVFDAQYLSRSHRRAASELLALLNAFAAEETLERIRNFGSNINDSDLKNAKSCVRRAHTAASCTMDLVFYVGNTDTMVSASIPSGCDMEIHEAVDVLLSLLQHSDEIKLIPDRSGEFYTMEKEEDSQALAYFCFIRVTKTQQIHIEAYHPKGYQASSEIISMMRSVISSACHRTNQLLLLKRLHVSRLASELLIPLENNVQETSTNSNKPDASGSFQCPIVFRHQFSTFYRCSTAAILRTVESTVLYPFIISNNRSYFVYKDESESIFYMKLNSCAENQIVLLVRGISVPTTSITLQLTNLIQKRLLQCGVDMLSSMLIKNSHYAWKQADFEFVRTFEKDWKEVDIGKEYDDLPDRYYGFADHATNSNILLLLLRQNLCGSTFFHVLNDADLSISEVADDAGMASGQLSRFYYNNAPATLDPTLQPNSTLTTKGAEYARLAGTGVAIIEVNFNYVARERDEIISGPLPKVAPTNEALTLKRLEVEPQLGASYVKVTIISTALRRKIIHDWIELSLNQVLVSFAIERLISCTKAAQLKSALSTSSGRAGANAVRRATIESISPALPALQDLLDSDSPHPAILKSLHQGTIRSSNVSHIALVALETLTKQLNNECKGDLGPLLLSKMCTIRLSRSSGPRRCQLKWTENRATTVIDIVEESTNMTRRVIDRNVDCPEYVFAFISTNGKDENISWPSQLKLFGDIVINDKSENTVDADTRIFQRSFAFILSIKRNQRLLYAYNWKRSTFKCVVTQLMEKEEAFFSSAATTVETLQNRCLKFLAPKSVVATEKHQSTPMLSGDTIKDDGQTNQRTVEGPDDISERQGRRATRPIAIRRPKLIGASVEGAAIHALTASRQRASSNLFKTGLASGTNTQRKIAEKSTIASPSSVNKLLDARKEFLPKQLDSTIQSAKRYQAALLSMESDRLRAHGTQYRAACQSFKTILQRKPSKGAPLEMNHFIFSALPSAVSWSDSTGDFASLPPETAVSHLSSFAKTLCGWIPGLKASLCSNESEDMKDTFVFLAGVMKTTELFRFKLVIRLTFEGFVVRSEVKLFYVDRRTKESYYTIRAMREKACARLRSFAASIRHVISLDPVVFDYLSSVGQVSLKRPSPDLAFGDAFHLVSWLNAQHGLKRQVKLYRGLYKVFGCMANPSSYHDPLVDEFGGSRLLHWMLLKPHDPDTIKCDQDTLYFTRELIVRGTRSTCFVSANRNIPNMLRLVFLCRSEGRNLFDFTFRDGLCVAMTILDRIAVEGADLLLQELRKAALTLRLERLWNSLTQMSSVRPSQLDLEMLLKLSHVTPLTHAVASTSDIQFVSRLFDGYTNWEPLFEKMMNDAMFSPSWALTGSNSCRQRLFYMKPDDLFLSLTVDDGDHLVDVSLVTRDAPSINSGTLQSSVAQKICNYLLFFLWSELVQTR